MLVSKRVMWDEEAFRSAVKKYLDSFHVSLEEPFEMVASLCWPESASDIAIPKQNRATAPGDLYVNI